MMLKRQRALPDQLDSGSSQDGNSSNESEEDLELLETAAQKRLRLAKGYLAHLHSQNTENDGEIDAAEIDKEIIAQRLVDHSLKKDAKSFEFVASALASFTHIQESIHTRSARAVVTSLAFAKNINGDCYVYVADKTANISKYCFYTGKLIAVLSGASKTSSKRSKPMQPAKNKHTDQILTLDASYDGQFLASGGRDKKILIWDTTTDQVIAEFTQHRDAISSLKFQKSTNQLYSASFDRTIKVWNIDTLSYIETLFGHQDLVTCLDTLNKERCLTVGSRDRTARVWKIVEESQLVFRYTAQQKHEDLVVSDEILQGKKDNRKDDDGINTGGNMDICVMVDEDLFLTGTDAGAISLWSNQRKKPLFTRLNAHGPNSRVRINEIESLVTTDPSDPINTKCDDNTMCKWITSLATVPYTDLFASGSGDGFVKLWRISESKKSFVILNCIAISGIINSLKFIESPVTKRTTENEVKNTQIVGVKERILHREIRERYQAKVAHSQHLLVAVGREHRLGRWWCVKNCEPAVVLVTLPSFQ